MKLARMFRPQPDRPFDYQTDSENGDDDGGSCDAIKSTARR